jgi:serine-type D-Ala-D-Ala carboxypeptidase/endopeptidase (penicillin-binding protein 4)
MRLNRNVALVAAASVCACGIGATEAFAQNGHFNQSVTSVAKAIAAGKPDTSAAISAASQNSGNPKLGFSPPKMAADTGAVAKLRATLNSDIDGHGGTNSALVIDETTNRTLWDTKIKTWRLPASNEKLYTTTTALLKFGSSWRTRTGVWGVGKLESNGTFKGTLYLRGGGDPTFGSSSFDKLAYGTGATVQRLAAKLKAAGVKSVDGPILADASLFDGKLGGPATGYRENVETEGAIGALTYNAGWTNDYEDALVRHPAVVATQAFAAAMRADKIKVGNASGTVKSLPRGARFITGVNSPDLSTLMELTNSPSDNFFAETLDKQLGAHFAGHGTTAAGAGVVRSEIAKVFDLHPLLNDGSGLSRYDKTTAEQVVYLLRRMQHNSTFWNSLAIAGVRGTLVTEMLHSRAVNNCRGKTGTLHDVANLSGYCTAANGDKIVFSFLMNGLTDPDGGHDLEADAAVALANFRG